MVWLSTYSAMVLGQTHLASFVATFPEMRLRAGLGSGGSFTEAPILGCEWEKRFHMRLPYP